MKWCRMTLCSLAGVLLTPALVAAQVDTAWVRRHDGPAHRDDAVCAIAVDAQGSAIVTGVSYDALTRRDLVVIKYRLNGDTAWVRRWCGTGPGDTTEEIGTAVAVDPAGNVYVTGTATSRMSGCDIVTLKYSPSGTLLWTPKTWAGPDTSRDRAVALAVNSGGVYVAGTTPNPSDRKSDCLVLKYDLNGNLIWSRLSNSGAGKADSAHALALDPQGNALVTGRVRYGTTCDCLTIKLRGADGAQLWAGRYDGGSRDDWGNAVATGPAGEVYVAGMTNSYNAASGDYLTLRLNPETGDTLWARKYSGPAGQFDEARAIALDPAGSVYVTGFSTGIGTGRDFATIKYRPTGSVARFVRDSSPGMVNEGGAALDLDANGNVYVVGPGQAQNLCDDCIIIQYDSLLTRRWLHRYHGPADSVDVPYDLGVTPGGIAYVAAVAAAPGTGLDGVTIRYGRRDVACLGLDMPVLADSGVGQAVLCRVANLGDAPAPCTISVWVNNVLHSRDCCPLPANCTLNISFPDWTPNQVGTFVLLCKTGSGLDDRPDNNGAACTVRVAAHDAGVRTILTPVGGLTPGREIEPRARVFRAWPERETVSVTFTIDCDPAYRRTTLLPHGLPEGETTLVFPRWTTVIGEYAARCSVSLANDLQPANDTLTSYFAVGTKDAGITLLLRPLGNIGVGRVVPAARVRNYGTNPVDLPVAFSLLCADTVCYTDTQPVAGLAPGVEVTVSFDTLVMTPGNYLAKVRCRLYGDSHPANDSMMCEVISRAAPPGWTQLAGLPPGPKNKAVKDGGALAACDSLVYAFKGGNTNEFYAWNIVRRAWGTGDTIPGIGRSGKKKYVKKGASLVARVPGRTLYAVKGNSSLEFWSFDCDSQHWRQQADAPLGTCRRTIKEGGALGVVGTAADTFVCLLKGSGTFEFYRYTPSADSWSLLAGAPAGSSGRPFKNGSCGVALGDRFYVLKGSYNEFFAYNATRDTWTELAALPLSGSGGRKVKAKAGTALATGNGTIYALKGGGSNEFWTYSRDSNYWRQLPGVAGGKVKGGGALAVADNRVYALRGGNTNDLWSYGSNDLSAPAPAGWEQDNQSSLPVPHPSRFDLCVNPNPWLQSGLPLAVSYSLPRAGNMSLKLYDVTGKLVTTLAEGYRTAGSSSFSVHRSAFSSGIYLVTFETGGSRTATTKLVIH